MDEVNNARSGKMTETDFFERAFGKANPSPGKQYDFEYASVSNPRLGVVCINWAARGVGFGEVTLLLRENGKIHIDTEYMDKEFVNELMEYIVSQSTKDPDPTPEDCYGSAAHYEPEEMPTNEEICVAYEVVNRLVQHHNLAGGDYLEDLKKRADDAHKRWFDKLYK